MKSNKRHSLSKVEIEEVSLVDVPANQHAHVVLCKRGESIPGRCNREIVKGGQAMNPEELAKALKARDVEVTDLTKRAEQAEGALATANTALETVTKAATDAGMTVDTAEDGAVTVAKAADREYIEIDGERVEKSAIHPLVLKRLEASDTSIKKMQEERDFDVLRKRAIEMLPDLAGAPEVKAELLKSVESIKDDDVRKGVLESLKAANASVSKMFAEVGSGIADEASPEFKLNKMAEDYAVEKGVSFYQAYEAITKAGEGSRLMAETRKQ